MPGLPNCRMLPRTDSILEALTENIWREFLADVFLEDEGSKKSGTSLLKDRMVDAIYN